MTLSTANHDRDAGESRQAQNAPSPSAPHRHKKQSSHPQIKAEPGAAQPDNEHDVSSEAPPAVVPAEAPRSRRRAVFLGLTLTILALGAGWYVREIGRETTDDAQVDADVVAIPARTAAVVKRIAFADNQKVHAGDLLIELDDVPAKARLAQAEAALSAAEASSNAADADARVAELNARGNRSMARASLVGASSNVESSQDQVLEAQASLQAAEVAAERSHNDYERTARLAQAGSIAQAELEHAKAQDDQSQAALIQAKAHLQAVQTGTRLASSRVQEAAARLTVNDVDSLVIQAQSRATVAHAQVAVAQAARDSALLDVSYTRITAPQDGVVSKRSVGVGQMVSIGQTVVQFVPQQQVWVTAHFKETQLAHLKPGQRVDVSVDAAPSAKVVGVVDSFSGATGARFALLPPDNATGNFTKVVQRVPVRIRLTQVPADVALMPGMSVELVAHTR
jgi:membrane fusion protein (multidrug efflux system)